MKKLENHAHAQLDVARGLAALAVFGAHLADIFFLRLVGPDNLASASFSFLARHAVLVFFLMSGHLITRSILMNVARYGRFDVLDYAAARVARIYPPFLGAIVICLLVWLVIHGLDLPGAVKYGLPGDLYRIRDSYSIAGSDIIRALTMRSGLLEANGSLWSLYVEFQIYVVAMAVTAAAAGDSAVSRITCVLLGLAALWLLRDQMVYVVVWIIGAATTIVFPSRRLLLCLNVAAGLFVVVMAFWAPAFIVSEADLPPGLAFQLAACVLYATLLFFTPPRRHYPQALVATGNFSYSLYVAHFPLLLLAMSLSQNWIQHSMAKTACAAILSAILILAFIVPFARLTEQQSVFKLRILRLARKRPRTAVGRDGSGAAS